MKALYTSAAAAALMIAMSPADSASGGTADLNSRIKASLSKLDTANDDHWTDAGLPRVERLRDLTGDQGITRRMVEDAAPGFNRANAHAAPSDTSTLTSKQTPVAEAGADTPIPVQIVKANEIGEPDAGSFMKSAAEISKENADPDLTAGEAAANTATSMYPEITAAGEGQPGNDDGSLFAGDEDRPAATVEPSAIADSYPDAFALLDALAIVAAQPRYRRNGELQQLIRSYSIQQTQMRDLQGRLDARDEARAARQDDDAAKVA